jgi:hypothetical protein
MAIANEALVKFNLTSFDVSKVTFTGYITRQKNDVPVMFSTVR